MIRFYCSNCGQKFKCSEKHAGSWFPCPGCGTSNQVPGGNYQYDSARLTQMEFDGHDPRADEKARERRSQRRREAVARVSHSWFGRWFNLFNIKVPSLIDGARLRMMLGILFLLGGVAPYISPAMAEIPAAVLITLAVLLLLPIGTGAEIKVITHAGDEDEDEEKSEKSWRRRRQKSAAR